MAVVALAQALRDIEAGSLAQVYAVVGEEPFQVSEFVEKLRAKIAQSEGFNYDVFDAESVPPADLLASLDTLPGLFDAPDAIRLVVCRRFEKAPALLWERLEPYFKSPNPQTVFLLVSEKLDRRKNAVKDIEKSGTVIEVNEPYDREWPKWRGFFEKRCGKSIEPAAWEALVDAGNRMLSLVAGECEKAALFVGERKEIRLQDVRDVSGTHSVDDVFQLSEDVVARRSLSAMLKLHRLLLSGESEIKILAILLRHFRQVAVCLQLMEKGIRDPKVMAPQIGVPPFFVPKIQELARGYDVASLNAVMRRLAACDFRLKTGEGTLWGDFLVPHFQKAPYF